MTLCWLQRGTILAGEQQQVEQQASSTVLEPGVVHEAVVFPSPSQLDASMGAAAPTSVFMYHLPTAPLVLQLQTSYAGER